MRLVLFLALTDPSKVGGIMGHNWETLQWALTTDRRVTESQCIARSAGD